jgi:hypothetical protein
MFSASAMLFSLNVLHHQTVYFFLFFFSIFFILDVVPLAGCCRSRTMAAMSLLCFASNGPVVWQWKTISAMSTGWACPIHFP